MSYDTLIGENRLSRVEISVRENLFSNLAELSNVVKPDSDESSWMPVTVGETMVGGEVPKQQLEEQARRLRAAAYRAYYTNPHAKSAVDNLVNFIFGKGAEIVLETPKGLTEDDLRPVREEWEEFVRTNKWRRLQKECGRRAIRDGESFLRYIPADKKNTTLIHFLEPDWIQSNRPEISYGIETEEGDVANIKSYRVNLGGGNEKDSILEPSEVQHSKLNVDSNVKRGRSSLETVLGYLSESEDFIKNRVIAQRLRTAVVMVQKVKGSRDQIQANIDSTKATQNTATRGTNRQKAIKPGTRMVIDKDSDIEFINPNLGAGDAMNDHRMILLAISAGVNLPEFVLTADAKNNNRASIEQAILTLIKFVEEQQSYWNEEFCDVFDKVINYAIVTKRLSKQFANVRCSFKFPAFDIRDFLDDAQAVQILLANGIISKSSAAAKFGLDFVKEVERMIRDKEIEVFPNSLFVSPPLTSNGDNEDNLEDGSEEQDNAES